MLNKRILNLLLFLMIFFVTSCGLNSSTSSEISSSSTSSSSLSSDIDSSSTSSSAKISYEKDSEGFYMLEDDYFKNDFVEDGKKMSKIRFAKELEKDYTYKQMRLFVGDKQIPLLNCKTNMSQRWNGEAPSRMNNSVAIVELDGIATFKLQCNFAIMDECIISPLSANIVPEIDDNRRVITFQIRSSGQYTIQLRSKRTLHLFVNDYKQYEEYKNQSNIIYFGPGIHTKDNSSYINSNNVVQLASNQTVFVDLGAIVHARFEANNKSNVKIVGSGIIDGSIFERSADKGTTLVPYDFQFSKNITIEGITTTDPAGWCYNIYFCDGVKMDNIKIISSRSNGDGISVQSCQNVEVTNSFIRGWDDNLVVKNYPKWSNRNEQGFTKNIYFGNCILWTDLAQSMEVGFETVGEVMENITFENITVINNFHKAIISVHNGNNANIKNVIFRNITVENADVGNGDGNKYLIEISVEYSATWSDKQGHTSLGSLDGLEISNVVVLNGIDDLAVSIRGSVDSRNEFKGSEHYISNVTVSDVYIYNKLLDSSYKHLSVYMTKNIKFEKKFDTPTGAIINFDDVSEYGKSFSIETV